MMNEKLFAIQHKCRQTQWKSVDGHRQQHHRHGIHKDIISKYLEDNRIGIAAPE